MKLIKAYIREEKTKDVFKALDQAGFHSMTFAQCQGTGQYSDHERKHISPDYPFAEACKVVKLEILVADEHVDPLVSTIRKSGRTGYQGDGMILVSPVDQAYKVRNDEAGILNI